MSSEEINNSEEVEKESTQTESKPTFKDKLIAFLKKNKAASVLSIALIVVFIWFSVKIRINEKNFNNEKTQLITQYESTIDSLQIAQLEFATKVFSWSVRSELLRNNTENLNQLLTVFVKESGADLVQLIKPEDKMVLLSSDKKFEGNPYAENLDFELKESTVVREESNVKIITPVMGFNNMIGILIVELRSE
ncbi:MAG: hypothetical protein Q8T08_17440 [Ignavibacteria bacterium]|nr:hypothetical protein [Ignavibacteria bacterium]